MRTGEAVDRNEFVPQRNGQDCIIASIATVIRRQSDNNRDFYTQVANALPPAGTKGIAPLDTIFPLLRLGWLAAPLVSKEAPNPDQEDRRHFPTSNEIKSVLAGRYAVIGYQDPDIRDHALAWTGSRAIDCSNGTYVTIEDITIDCALILAPAPPEGVGSNLGPKG
jgi:hypothetical protein